MEKLKRNDSGDLVITDRDDKTELEENSPNNERPFEGISSALKKMKNNQELRKTENWIC